MKRKKGKTVDKHFTYFAILEAMRNSSGCAFCDLKKKVSFNYLDGLLYEKVNDGGIRKELLKSNGFCHRHAHELVALGGALGIGIIYDAQISHFLLFLDSKKQNVLKKSRKSMLNMSNSEDKTSLFHLWFKKNTCPVCRIENEAMERYFKIFIDSLKAEKEMREAFESSHGICVPHFLKLIDYTDDVEIGEYLLKYEKQKLKNIQVLLKEFIRKEDYRFKEEPISREEGRSWIDSVRMMTGFKGAF